MTTFVRGSSSIFRFEAHVSFKTKYSHRVFDIVEFKERCRELLLEAAADIGIQVIEIGFDRDHVHLVLAWLRITLSLDQIAKALKGRSGRILLTEFPGIKCKFFWGSGLWGDQIYGDSLGRDLEMLCNYSANQGKKSDKYQVTLKSYFNIN